MMYYLRLRFYPEECGQARVSHFLLIIIDIVLQFTLLDIKIYKLYDITCCTSRLTTLPIAFGFMNAQRGILIRLMGSSLQNTEILEACMIMAVENLAMICLLDIWIVHHGGPNKHIKQHSVSPIDKYSWTLNECYSFDKPGIINLRCYSTRNG